LKAIDDEITTAAKFVKKGKEIFFPDLLKNSEMTILMEFIQRC